MILTAIATVQEKAPVQLEVPVEPLEESEERDALEYEGSYGGE
jgi:hypothetical protein